MKLLINGWFWGQTTTGSGQYLHGLLRHLPAALPGWEITLLLPQQAGRPQGYAPTHAFPAPAGARMMRASLPPYARGARLVKLAWEQRVFPAWCKRLDADVALAPYWGSPIRPPCPTLVTIHDLIPLLLDDYASKPTARAYTWLVGRSAQRADAVLTVSQSARDDIVQHLGIPAERVIVTYESLGAPHAPVTDADELERMRQRYNLPARYLFYLGGFDPRKNVPLLIRAYGRARTMRPDLAPLLVAGKLPGPEEAWFTDPRPLIAELGLGDHVRTLGFVPDQDKPALYTLADLFLFPSRYEGFGLPPLEAMACGTPALVSDSSSLPEVVGDTVPSVPVSDESALALAILDTLDHPPDPAILLDQAARFSWQETAAKTAASIRDVL
jgi:glycosyltransferase involved in cell wall biosynthesis